MRVHDLSRACFQRLDGAESCCRLHRTLYLDPYGRTGKFATNVMYTIRCGRQFHYPYEGVPVTWCVCSECYHSCGWGVFVRVCVPEHKDGYQAPTLVMSCNVNAAQLTCVVRWMFVVLPRQLTYVCRATGFRKQATSSTSLAMRCTLSCANHSSSTRLARDAPSISWRYECWRVHVLARLAV